MGLEARFERYCTAIVGTLAHVDRAQPARWYLKGLMLPGDRKSVEPMAARVQPGNVRSAHQSMHHLVADAAWSDEAMLQSVAKCVLPKLAMADEPVRWIVDDTGFPKKGKHSDVVAPQRSIRPAGSKCLLHVQRRGPAEVRLSAGSITPPATGQGVRQRRWLISPRWPTATTRTTSTSSLTS